jgi:histidinol-phosphate/aromatic aminotransferase/cobyric acid decarboxylase-like protein
MHSTDKPQPLGHLRSHGGPHHDELERLGLLPEDLIDFSVSTNPYGPAPAVVEAIRRAPVATYPDPSATLARRRLADHLGVLPTQLALGNGAADLLWSLARALVQPQTRVLIVEPTFGEFRAAAEAGGATVVEWRASYEDAFRINPAAIADRARAARAQVAYLCAPNVPTGVGCRALDVAALATALPDVEILLDQSFLLLSEHWQDHTVPLPENVTCVRSLTKEHAIPGVRLGYVLASQARIERLGRHRPAWSTSAPAQAAAIAACAETAFVAESRDRLLQDRLQLTADLTALRLQPLFSTANFFLLPVRGAADLRRRLLANHRILVRDCASFGLPSFVRLSARPAADRDRLVAALRLETQRC